MSGASSHEAPEPASQWAEALAVVQIDWPSLAALPQELQADRTIQMRQNHYKQFSNFSESIR
eukprot:2354926-Amphidinium_carterae.1